SFHAVVYGLKRHAFISECVIQRQSDGSDFIALELYNPNPDPHGKAAAMDLHHYSLAIVDRSGGVPVLVDMLPMPAALTGIPSNDRVVLYDGPVPANIGLPFSRSAAVPNLARAIGHEVILLRTRHGGGTGSSQSGPAGFGPMGPASQHNHFDESQPLDRVPLDQLDLRQAAAPTAAIGSIR